MLGLGNSDVPGADGLPGEGGEEGAVWPLQEVNFLIDGKIALGLGSCDVQVLTAYSGKEVNKGCPNFAGGKFLFGRKIVLGLGHSNVQVLSAYPGKEMKKGLTDFCRRLILIWQENCAGTWQL